MHPRQPLVSQFGAAVQVDGGNHPHVGLAPFAAAVRDLGFEEFEDIQTQGGFGDAQDSAQDLAGFELHEEQDAVGFVAGEFLEGTEEVDGGVELAEAEGLDGRGGVGCWGGGVSELVDGGVGEVWLLLMVGMVGVVGRGA